MFFIMGMSDGRKELQYGKMLGCGVCGTYSRVVVFMIYSYFSFFFIPLFKWNRRYFVQMECCGSIYQLDPEVGRQLERGEDVEIRPQDLTLVQSGNGWNYTNTAGAQGNVWGMPSQNAAQGRYGTNKSGWDGQEIPRYKECKNCGYATNEDFEYCPKCGRPFHEKTEQ